MSAEIIKLAKKAAHEHSEFQTLVYACVVGFIGFLILCPLMSVHPMFLFLAIGVGLSIGSILWHMFREPYSVYANLDAAYSESKQCTSIWLSHKKKTVNVIHYTEGDVCRVEYVLDSESDYRYD
jgi:hypothetical protein